jgi:hypothetical protein
MNRRIAVIGLMLAVGIGVQAQERMRAGLWENSVTSGGKTATRKNCVTPHQAEMSKGTPAMLKAESEKALAKSGSCTLKEFSLTGNTKTEVMVCGQNTIKNVTTFHGDSFETTATSTKGGVDKVALMKGKRIGECPAGGVE